MSDADDDTIDSPDAAAPDKVELSMDQWAAARVAQRRRKRGVRGEDMAAALGVAIETYRRWERGDSKLTPGRLYLIAMVLETPVAWFLSDFPLKLKTSDVPKSTGRVTAEGLEMLEDFNLLTPNSRNVVRMTISQLPKMEAGARDVE